MARSRQRTAASELYHFASRGFICSEFRAQPAAARGVSRVAHAHRDPAALVEHVVVQGSFAVLLVLLALSAYYYWLNQIAQQFNRWKSARRAHPHREGTA